MCVEREDEVDEHVEEVIEEGGFVLQGTAQITLNCDDGLGAPGTYSELNGTIHVASKKKKGKKKKKGRAAEPDEPEPDDGSRTAERPQPPQRPESE